MYKILFFLVILICCTTSAAQVTEKRVQNIESRLSLLEGSVKFLGGLNECPNGWKKWNGHCYYFSRETLTWDQARRYCTTKASHLVKIENLQENTMVVSEVRKLGSNYFWIGANDIAREGTWVWESDGTAVSYAKWASGEPNNIGGGLSTTQVDCGHLHYRYNYQWDDQTCLSKQNYICKKAL